MTILCLASIRTVASCWLITHEDVRHGDAERIEWVHGNVYNGVKSPEDAAYLNYERPIPPPPEDIWQAILRTTENGVWIADERATRALISYTSSAILCDLCIWILAQRWRIIVLMHMNASWDVMALVRADSILLYYSTCYPFFINRPKTLNIVTRPSQIDVCLQVQPDYILVTFKPTTVAEVQRDLEYMERFCTDRSMEGGMIMEYDPALFGQLINDAVFDTSAYHDFICVIKNSTQLVVKKQKTWRGQVLALMHVPFFLFGDGDRAIARRVRSFLMPTHV